MIVVCARESPRSPIIHEITKAEFVAQIPAHAEDDDFTVEISPLKSSSMFGRPIISIIRPICRR